MKRIGIRVFLVDLEGVYTSGLNRQSAKIARTQDREGRSGLTVALRRARVTCNDGLGDMAKALNERVQKRRDALRALGLRPVQIWVPDTRRPGFGEECARQARLVAQADATDREILAFLDAAQADLDGILE